MSRTRLRTIIPTYKAQSHVEIISVRVGFQYLSAEYVNRLNEVPGLYCTFNLILYLICTDLAHSPLLVYDMNH